MREKLEQELAAWKRRLAANEKNNLEAGVKKAEKEIARIENDLLELEAKEAANADMKKEDPAPKKEKKSKKVISKKVKGKGVKALIKDEPKATPLDPDCDELLSKFKESAKKARTAQKKRAAKPESEKIVESAEKVAESIENKVEKLEDEGKGLGKEATKKLEIYTTQFIKSIEGAIKEESARKEFIKGLIAKLQKML